MAGVPPPTWVDSGSRLTDGLDLLGLRQPVQAIGGVLLDGITSVTPNIRYLSFMCWLIYRYAAAGMPDRWSDFLKFAHRAEAALVMGNLLANQWISGLVGPIRSQNRLASDDGMLDLDPVANTPAVALYLTSAAQLHLIEFREGEVPRLVTQRGLRLAEALDESIGDLEIAKQITSASAPQRVSRGDLLALGKAIPMNQLSESERSILGDSLIPKHPLIREKSRVATYGSLLLMAQKIRRPPTGHEFLSAACLSDRFGDNRLDDWADGWLAYGIRDVLAVTHEFLCAEVIDELMYLGGEEKLPIDPKAVIRNLLSREADLKDTFIRLGVLTNFDALADLRINDLNDQVIKLTSKDRGLSNGLYRWDGPITEGAIIERALATKTGCVGLVLLAWLLVDCIVDLDHARAAVRTVEPLLGLEEDRAPNEQRRLISAIQMVIDSLFSDAANFPDPAAPPKKEAPIADENSEPAELLDPAKILCSLSDDDAIESTMGAHRSSHPLLTLSGILRLLFADSRRLQDPPTDPDTGDGEETQRGADGNQPHDKKEGPSVDERNAQRLVEQVNTFFARLEESEFAETCTAAQLVQAIAFPLAVAELGRQNGWVTSSILERWATRLFHLLFRRNAGKTGLLHDVWKRYESAGRPEIFSAAVGDGALWAALVSAVANSRWEGIAAGFEKALAIRELFRTPILLGAADKRLLSRYSIALRAREATAILRQLAPQVVMAFEALEALVEQSWHEQAKQGMVGPCPAEEGNLLWRPNVGWAFGLGPCAYPERVAVRLKGKPAEVMKGFYLNVTKLADQNEEVSEQIRRINDTIKALEGSPLAT